ncbi:Wall-associated kinase family protein [Perilla frutescens var. hirtella]|uniref:Wall-associated kinase family protein n=1 Tax=Perilla frutescens var. hirtella TaxID=608512 RepID=A0AAD4J5Z1_PERFH|nr:Wall-associated kinase family protein [Perilla frutescens var. hirtella]
MSSYSYYNRDIYYKSSSRYCYCRDGFEGNPYLLEGCSDIDECSNATLNQCGPYSICTNSIGSFSCEYLSGKSKHKRFRTLIKITPIVIGSVLGVLILLTAAWKSGKAITKIIKVIKASRKYMFFKQNGGILLEQQLATIENGLEKTKLFSSIELAKATDDYNENQILGRGGEGIVYKGMLEDGRIVAVKKTERVHQGDVEAFINEVIIVSQINHRNVVKLFGCCLESEVPRLVYEFIPNGTLFHHIHDPHEDFPLFWEMRVRIAKEVAGALAYLHSSTSVPIYHRDIKSTNILLDEKYRAKISDFGTSRSASIDQTYVTTRVVGTFGYLDPEYFQSNHFTKKSDVYSFGVVLVELLTGEKAISAARLEEGRGLAMYFLLSMDQNQLFDIVDPRVLREGKREEIEAMAEIAKRCLHLNGKSRPTMKEVAHHLEGIQVEKRESEYLQNQIESGGCISVDEDDQSDNFSYISEIDLDL